MMTWAFYWQIIIGLLPFLVLHYWSAYWITVSHPFSRLPVFIIGVVLGILYQRLKIQGDELRADGKKRDDLQEVMQLIKKIDIGQPVDFTNFRD